MQQRCLLLFYANGGACAINDARQILIPLCKLLAGSLCECKWVNVLMVAKTSEVGECALDGQIQPILPPASSLQAACVYVCMCESMPLLL